LLPYCSEKLRQQRVRYQIQEVWMRNAIIIHKTNKPKHNVEKISIRASNFSRCENMKNKGKLSLFCLQLRVSIVFGPSIDLITFVVHAPCLKKSLSVDNAKTNFPFFLVKRFASTK
jgi:hypothetical protein